MFHAAIKKNQKHHKRQGKKNFRNIINKICDKTEKGIKEMIKIKGTFSLIIALIIAISASCLAFANGHGMHKGRIYDCCKATSLTGPISKVGVKVTEEGEDYWYGQIILFDRNGNIMYRGKPASEKNTAKGMLYGGPEGVSQAEALCDIDMDGCMEIVIAGPKSDVSPQEFTVLRWEDGDLKKVKTGYLTVTGKKANWTSTPDDNKGWVTSVKSKNGKLFGSVLSIADGNFSGFEATLQPNPGRIDDGFKLTDIKKLH